MGLTTTVVELVAIGGLLYTAYGAVYRLCLAPVAKFPGPKLAALTFWYEFYFDVIRCGSYVYEIERMHKQYGGWMNQWWPDANAHWTHIEDRPHCAHQPLRTPRSR